MSRPLVLAVDLDGTLISDVHDFARPVSAANLDALRDLRAAGTRVVISTGRNENSARSILARCGDPELAACDLLLQNGALVLDGASGAVLRERHLPTEEARRYLRVYRSHGLTPLLFTGHAAGGHCVYDEDPANERLGRYLEIRLKEAEAGGLDCLRRIDAIDDILDTPPLAMATIDHPQRLAPAREEMEALALPASRVALQGLVGRGGTSPAQFLEVFERTVSKELAFADYCALRGIPLERAAAIGDGRNDLELVREVGVGIAMGNAGPALKEAADHVAPRHDEDGLAVAVRRFLLA